MQECQVKRGAMLDALKVGNEFRSFIKILSLLNTVNHLVYMLCIFINLITNARYPLQRHFKLYHNSDLPAFFRPLPALKNRIETKRFDRT